MKDLEKNLKDKEPKKSLQFSAKDVDEVRRNVELETFLDAQDEAEFPKLTFKMFFKNKKDMQVHGQPQPPDQPPNVSPKYPNEPVTIKDPLKYTCGSTDVQNISETEKNSPAAESHNTSNKGSLDTQEKSEHKIIPQNEDLVMPAQEAQKNVQEREGSSVGFHTSTSRAVIDQAGEPSCSSHEPASGATTGSGKRKSFKKKNPMNDLLHDWARRQCDGSEEGKKTILEQISFTSLAEHKDKPCFTAENVIVYENPTTHESQIIFITEGQSKLSIADKTRVQYEMFVCGIKSAVLLSPREPKKQEIKNYSPKCFIATEKCERFISEAFAPSLALFKKIQKEELCQ